MPSIIVASGSTNIASGSEDGLTKSIAVGASESGGALEPELSPFPRTPASPCRLVFWDPLDRNSSSNLACVGPSEGVKRRPCVSERIWKSI